MIYSKSFFNALMLEVGLYFHIFLAQIYGLADFHSIGKIPHSMFFEKRMFIICEKLPLHSFYKISGMSSGPVFFVSIGLISFLKKLLIVMSSIFIL